MWIVLALILLLMIYGFWEDRNHQRNLDSIPVRIHVNGSRGKSSVTRLIGAGLRAGGKRVLTRTTGSKPRIIVENGEESPVIRPGRANIIEQLKIVRRAVSRRVEVVVLEWMGIQPHLQYVSEHQMVRSTVGVITNVRPDHLDEMGPTLEELADSLCNTIPGGGVLFTTEKEHLQTIQRWADLNFLHCKWMNIQGVNEAFISHYLCRRNREEPRTTSNLQHLLTRLQSGCL